MRKSLIALFVGLGSFVSHGQVAKRHAITLGVLSISAAGDKGPTGNDTPSRFHYANALLYTYAINPHVKGRARAKHARRDYRFDGGYTVEKATGNSVEAGIGAQYGSTYGNRLHLYAGAEAIAVRTRLAGVYYSDVPPFERNLRYDGRLYGVNLLAGAEWLIHRNVSLLVEPGLVLGSATAKKTFGNRAVRETAFESYFNLVNILGISLKL